MKNAEKVSVFYEHHILYVRKYPCLFTLRYLFSVLFYLHAFDVINIFHNNETTTKYECWSFYVINHGQIGCFLRSFFMPLPATLFPMNISYPVLVNADIESNAYLTYTHIDINEFQWQYSSRRHKKAAKHAAQLCYSESEKERERENASTDSECVPVCFRLSHCQYEITYKSRT